MELDYIMIEKLERSWTEGFQRVMDLFAEMNAKYGEPIEEPVKIISEINVESGQNADRDNKDVKENGALLEMKGEEPAETLKKMQTEKIQLVMQVCEENLERNLCAIALGGEGSGGMEAKFLIAELAPGRVLKYADGSLGGGKVEIGGETPRKLMSDKDRIGGEIPRKMMLDNG